MRRFLIMALSVVSILTAVGPSFTAAAAEKNEYTFDVAGFDVATSTGSICVYPIESSEKRIVGADEYGFRYSKLLIFDKNGKLIEAGGDIYANSSGVTGSPQTSVTVPAGGFMVAFSSSAPNELRKCFDTAMEGAMLYNATMSVIYEVYGSYNKNTKKLTVRYAPPQAQSEQAKKFLFVGNSSTYFNGTPIKFKGLSQAAGVEVDVDYCTFGSAFLAEFADESHERGKALRQKLSSKKYDYVVLQDAGSASYTSINAALSVILPLVQANGATPLLYMRYSAESNPNNRYDGAVTHYKNYTRISRERNIVCAPVAVAFLYCTEDYPKINLYADDNSHHSKEGSYLAACTFLYKYLGVSPVGNSYIAELDSEVASALQKCAVKACDEKFVVEDETSTYTENGIEYINLALGKTYVSTGKKYENTKWTDTNVNGMPMGKLTDGYVASSGNDTSIGCYQGNETSITIDLGDILPVKRMETDLYGNSGWGIPDPGEAKVSVSVSSDGETFTDLGNAEMSAEKFTGEWKSRVFSLTLGETVSARYVRVTYKLAGNFCWTSEIEVFGTKQSTQPVEESSQATSDNTSETQDSPKSEDSSESKSWPWIVLGAAAVAATVFVIIKSKKRK